MHKKTTTALVLFSLWLLMFSASSQFFIMAPILSQIGEQLNIPQNLQGTLISAYAITLGMAALVIGPVSDRVGRRKILLWGSGAMALALALHAFAVGYWSMLLIRGIAGVAGGILTGVCVAYIGDYFPYNKRGFANGVIITGSASGQILGIPLGTVMAGSYGFATPFLAFCAVMCLAFFMILFFVPQPNVNRQDKRLSPSGILGDYRSMLKKPVMLATAISYLLMFFSVTSFIVYFPTWLETDFGAGSKDIALIFFAGGVATFMGGPIGGKLADERGRKGIIMGASLGLAAVMLIVVPLSHTFYYALFMFFLVMLFMSGRMTSFQALASDIACGKTRGKLMCLTISIGQLGMALGSGISGFIYCRQGFLGNTVVAAASAIMMALFVWIMVPNMPVAETQQALALEEVPVTKS